MKQLFLKLPLLFAMVALLVLSACEKDAITPEIDSPETSFVSEGLPPNVVVMTGAEMIDLLSTSYGDVSEKTGLELTNLYSEQKNIAEAKQLRQGFDGEKNETLATPDVYSSSLIAFTIPYDGAPPNLYTFYIDNTPPLVGCPSVQSVRTLQFNVCPNFVQITTTANVYKNNSSISGVSDTERAPFGCGGRQVRSFARATIFPVPICSATTQATISCARRGLFCLEPAPGPVLEAERSE